MLNIIKLKITGTRPLLMNSDIYTNPLDERTKRHQMLIHKKKKTADDHEIIARSSWRGSMYFDDDIGPYLPGVNVESSLIAGAKLSRLGTQIKRSIEIIEDRCPLMYDGPRTVESLWSKKFYDARCVKVKMSRVMRYRPLFMQWQIACTVAFDPESIDRQQVIKSFQDAGQYIGIGDYRPKFGRYTVEENQ